VASVILECIETEEQSMTLPPILVTGGTGTLGQQVVSRLREAGRDVRVLSRRSRTSQDGLVFATGDLAAGVGLPAAVRGVGTIVHCAAGGGGDPGSPDLVGLPGRAADRRAADRQAAARRAANRGQL